jgi:hypothetical protein
MVDNNDAALTSDADLHQTLHVLPRTSNSNSNTSRRMHKQRNNLSTSLPGPESDDENTRLLNPTGNMFGDDDEGSENEESEFLKEFSGLPWWKRPSVCAQCCSSGFWRV